MKELEEFVPENRLVPVAGGRGRKNLTMILGAAGLLLLAMVVAFVVGASRGNARATEMENHADGLSRQLQALQDLHHALAHRLETNIVAEHRFRTNAFAWIDRLYVLRQIDNERMTNFVRLEIVDLQLDMSRRSSPTAARPVYVAPHAAGRAATTKRGVPLHVYGEIAARAAEKWPDNFRMQEVNIDTEIAAYLKLSGK